MEDDESQFVNHSRVAALLQEQKPEVVSLELGSQPKNQLIWNRGFVKPDEIRIVEYGDGIRAGQELRCMTGNGYSTDHIYLAAVKEFKQVDQFICKMTKWYKACVGTPRTTLLMVSPTDIKIGVILAVYVNKEWKRARVEEIVTPKQGPEPMYNVLLLDLGEVHLVSRSELFYLHADFTGQPRMAIRTRLPKMDGFYRKYRRRVGALDRRTWDKAVIIKLSDMVYDKPFGVKFLEKVEMEGEAVWEVQLLGFSGKKHGGGDTLEKKVMQKCFPGTSFWKDGYQEEEVVSEDESVDWMEDVKFNSCLESN